jgi:hypothetical protein
MIFGSSIGATPNIEYTTPYMLFYDWTSNTLAERYGSNNFHIKFLIDETGSVYKPEYSSSYWYTVSQAFGSDTEVNISMYDMPVFVKSQTSEKTTVYRSLKQFETILYTDTGSHGDNYLHSGYFTTMSFVTPSNNYISNLDEDFNLSGDYNFDNVTVAVAMGLYFKMKPNEISKGIESYFPTNNRSEIIKKEFNTIYMDAYNANPGLANLMVDPWFAEQINRRLPSLRQVVAGAAQAGIPVPCFSSALDYIDSYRSSRLPQNLVQAMRDCFGAHTYERTDRPGSFHTEWMV